MKQQNRQTGSGYWLTCFGILRRTLMLMFYFAKRRALNRIIILLFWRPNVCSVLASVKLNSCSVLCKARPLVLHLGLDQLDPFSTQGLTRIHPLYHTINRECTGGYKRQEPVCWISLKPILNQPNPFWARNAKHVQVKARSRRLLHFAVKMKSLSLIHDQNTPRPTAASGAAPRDGALDANGPFLPLTQIEKPSTKIHPIVSGRIPLAALLRNQGLKWYDEEAKCGVF